MEEDFVDPSPPPRIDKIDKIDKITAGVGARFGLASHLRIDKIDKIDKITGGWEEDFVDPSPPPRIDKIDKIDKITGWG